VLIDLFAQRRQLLEDRVVLVELDVGIEDELRDAERVLARHAGDRRLFLRALAAAGEDRHRQRLTAERQQQPAAGEPSSPLHRIAHGAASLAGLTGRWYRRLVKAT